MEWDILCAVFLLFFLSKLGQIFYLKTDKAITTLFPTQKSENGVISSQVAQSQNILRTIYMLVIVGIVPFKR
jgi:hypothetical protein